MVKPSSLLPAPISLRLSTEPPVTSAVACTLGRLFDEHVGDGAAERIVDAAGAAGADRHGLLLRMADAGEGEPRKVIASMAAVFFIFVILNPFLNYVVSAGRSGARVLACHSNTPRPMIRPGT